MGPLLSPAKVVLLAVHLAAHADIDSLTSLASQHRAILRNDIVLRILLTHLPETVSSASYVGLLQQLAGERFAQRPDAELDISPVQDLDDNDAAKKVRKLHLLPLSCPDAPKDVHDDPLALFLFHRAYKVDQEAGLLTQLPDLLTPFLSHTPAIRTWLASTVLPLLRRNCEYYPEPATALSLLEFQRLPAVNAVDYLLACTGVREQDYNVLGRDLRGLIAPWLHGESHWRNTRDNDPSPDSDATSPAAWSPAWEHVLEWLTLSATRSWKVPVGLIDQWDGPRDADCGESITLVHQEARQQYLDDSYAQAALAAAYLIPEATEDALKGAYDISSKVNHLLGDDSDLPLTTAASDLPHIATLEGFTGAKTVGYMRNDLLLPDNPLTSPSTKTANLLATLALSAFISIRLGLSWTVRKTGELAFLQDQRDQKAEVSKLIRAVSSHAPRGGDDDYWSRARREVLWLHSWGGPQTEAGGVLGAVPPEFIEAELLKALLSNSRKLGPISGALGRVTNNLSRLRLGRYSVRERPEAAHIRHCSTRHYFSLRPKRIRQCDQSQPNEGWSQEMR